MDVMEYLKTVKEVPVWDRVPAISDKELDLMMLPPWKNPASSCYQCVEHTYLDCEECNRG